MKAFNALLSTSFVLPVSVQAADAAPDERPDMESRANTWAQGYSKRREQGYDVREP